MERMLYIFQNLMTRKVCDVPVRTGYVSFLKTRLAVALFGAAVPMLVEATIPLNIILFGKI